MRWTGLWAPAVVAAFLAGRLPAADAPAEIVRRIDHQALRVIPLGVTRAGNPINAVVHEDDFDFDTTRTRMLLVGQSAEAAQAIAQALAWFYRHQEAAQWRRQFIVSAVPLVFPDRVPPSKITFPPTGTAYADPEHAESLYAWRWIGLHAPDVAVDVQPGRTRSWFVPAADDRALAQLAARLAASRQGAAGELAAALLTSAPCETGLIPAVRVTLGTNAPPFLPELLSALAAAEFSGPSPARKELQQRLDRTPIEVATQLSRHYGRSLDEVAYIPAMALIGRVRLGELAAEETHLADVRRMVAPYLAGKKNCALNSASALSGHLIFSELAERSGGDERKRLIELSRQAADLAFDEQGNSRPAMPFHSEMSDAVFMGGPILAHTGKLTGQERYFDACLAHLRFMRKLLLRDDGLYRHSPLDPAAWGRGNGFPALGLALCLTHWPADRDDRKELLEMFRRHMEALLPHQDETGCWHQVIDRPESYRELTATCMITFALCRGVQNGWLDRPGFAEAIERGWRAVKLRVPSDGRLVDVCTGTGKQTSLRDYFDRPAILGSDPRGGAMALLAATELAAHPAVP